MGWKQWHTSKDQYLEAKKKVRRLFNRPNVKQKVKIWKYYQEGCSEMWYVYHCKGDGQN